MNPFHVFKYSALTIFVLLFCAILFRSGLKYSKRNTSFQKTTVNEEKLLYPSVSICKKYTFDDYIDEDLINPTVTLSQKQNLIRNNSWLRSRALFFLGHAGMLGLTYPCLTTMGGTDSAKLCSFPSPKDFSSPCDRDQTEQKVCYTRMTESGKKYWSKRGELKWGYCPKGCHGERANWSSPYNLAGREELWEGGLFDLRSWDVGICHTYHPPQPSDTELTSRLVLLLGSVADPASHWLDSFQVFLHEKGQFWPREDLFPMLSVLNGREMEASFKISKTRGLGLRQPCTMTKEYSLTSCMMDYFLKQTGCLFQEETNTLSCPSSEDVSKYFHTLAWAKTASVDELYQRTNCLPKCSYTEYRVRTGPLTSQNLALDFLQC